MPCLFAMTLVVLALLSSSALAQKAAAPGLDARINAVIDPAATFISDIIFYSLPLGDGIELPLILVWLVAAGLFFTLYLRFLNVRGFPHALKLVRGDYANPHDTGEVSHFQALATAVSGTVGLGNIAGVAVAIGLGGPGATFWMILAGFLGMSTKFAECTMGVKYRRENPDGSVSGGPMYYLSRGLKEKGRPRLGRVLAAIFALCCLGGAIGGGAMFQVNQAYSQMVNVTGGADSLLADKAWLFGLIFALLIGIVIIGGIRSIARVTSRLVPFMALLYVSAALVIIAVNVQNIPDALAAILAGAFSPEGVSGGFIGVLILGFRRAAFSNEAGVGAAAIAHSAVRTKEPATEGFVALLEPFIDTILVCSMTALVIIFSGVHTETGIEGVEMTSAAYATVLPWFPSLLSIAVTLFAFSTALTWSYYGLKGWTYLFGENRFMDMLFKALFCLFLVAGATLSLDSVIAFSDSMMFAMALPNLLGLYILAPTLRREIEGYLDRLTRGELVNYRTNAAIASSS